MASLRFLEYVHGEEEMGYKYEESSYMYTQLCMAFEVMELDWPLYAYDFINIDISYPISFFNPAVTIESKKNTKNHSFLPHNPPLILIQ